MYKKEYSIKQEAIDKMKKYVKTVKLSQDVSILKNNNIKKI